MTLPYRCESIAKIAETLTSWYYFATFSNISTLDSHYRYLIEETL